VALTFRARIGKFLAVLTFVGIVVLLALQIYSEATTSVVGMIDRGDTRTRVWAAMWQDFVDNPVMGTWNEAFGIGENSYLAAAGGAGLLGFVPLVACVLCTIYTCLRVNHSRKLLGTEKPLADAVTGIIGALLAGGMFEGHFLGTLTFSVLITYGMCALLAFLLDAIDVEQQRRQLSSEVAPGQEPSYEEALAGAPLGFAEHYA
jgi:hypothetical protein